MTASSFSALKAPDSTDKDVFKWSKNYEKAIDAGRARLENKTTGLYSQ